jgi:hypothetical protein
MGIVDNRSGSAKRKKFKTLSNHVREAETPVLIALSRIPVQKQRCDPPARALWPFTRNLPSIGLSERIDPLDRDSTTNRHA